MAILNFDNIGVAGRDGWQRLFLFKMFKVFKMFKMFKVFKVFSRSRCSHTKNTEHLNKLNTAPAPAQKKQMNTPTTNKKNVGWSGKKAFIFK